MIAELVRFLGTQEIYETYIKYIKKEFLPKEAWDVLEFLPSYWKETGATEVLDWNEVYSLLALKHPSKPSLSLSKALCESVARVTAAPSLEVLQTLHNRSYAESIAEQCIAVAEGKTNSFKEISALLDHYKRTSVKLERELVETKQEDMYESLSSIKTTGMKWYIEPLNTILGPLNNEFILLASRPDGGKTTFLANEAWNIAKQLPGGKQVLWFNNEEHIRKVKMRVIQSYLSVDKSTILSNIIDAVKLYEDDVGKDRIVFIDDANHISKVEKALDKYDPGLIIIDQLYKVQGKFDNKNELEAERFRKLCEWAREIAKHRAPVIASNQLDGRAEGIKYPPMDSLYGSKTGAQGEADAILFIGKTPVDGDKRFIYCPKNKLTGSNEQFEVTLMKEIARYHV